MCSFVCLLACLFVRLFDFLCFSAGLSFLSVFLGFFLRVQWFRFRIQGQGFWFRDFGFGAAASRFRTAQKSRGLRFVTRSLEVSPKTLRLPNVSPNAGAPIHCQYSSLWQLISAFGAVIFPKP